MFGYISTRGRAPRLSFAGATMAGLAADGGLYVPEQCPKISEDEQANMTHQNYLEVAWRVILPFVSDDISSSELLKILRAAYRNFDNKDIAPLHKLEDNHYLLELFHGPTLAFKDVALQFLGQVFDHILAQENKKVTIVGATSGDTGSAAIEAFRGKANADIFILHPHNRVSEVQRRQMTTVSDANVFNIAVDGSFDDCQDLVKGMFNDPVLRTQLNLSAVNSINWARILAQVVYYFRAAVHLHGTTGKRVTFCVPTGNFGNVYAGYIAQSMGAPIERLIVATNSNDILHRFFETGTMKADGVAPTLSPSMDIQISSNFERLLFDLYGRNGTAVDKTLQHFRDTGPFQLDADTMARIKALFASGRCDDACTLETIKKTYQKYNYTLDPHTAVGVGVAEAYRQKNPDSLMVTLATAHPAKFPDAVKKATGVAPALPPRLAGIFSLPERYEVLPADPARIKEWVLAKAAQKR